MTRQSTAQKPRPPMRAAVKRLWWPGTSISVSHGRHDGDNYSGLSRRPHDFGLLLVQDEGTRIYSHKLQMDVCDIFSHASVSDL